MTHRAPDDLRAPWRVWLGDIIFGLETPLARNYNLFMILLVALSVCCVMMESAESLRRHYGEQLRAAEWVFTCIFTLDYFGRVISARHLRHYVLSYYGLIDLISILPFYLSLIHI